MKKTSLKLFYAAITFVFAVMFSACEGPPGLDGIDGQNGADGADASETCKLCHNPNLVDGIATQFELSKHGYGEAAFEEAGNASCGPCHLSEAFKYVCENNIPATFTLSGSSYVNNYSSIASAAYGDITCFTCHSKLHTTYGLQDLALTTVAAVPMSMYGGTKTIDLTQDGGISNLCVKCHQPRPFTRTFGDKNVIDYAALVSSPNTIFFDGANPTSTANVNTIRPAYRTHTHYGTAGAVFAGKGGIEFGTGYTNSAHTTAASCQDCHMAPMTGKAGGHTFVAKGNFNGCNVSGCHSGSPISSSTTTAYWKATRDAVVAKLNTIAGLLTLNGVEVMNQTDDSEANLWYALTAKHYDGYLNIYDPSLNPGGAGSANETGPFRNGNPSSSWTQAQKDFNLTLPILVLTNEQFGAIINFQLVLRDYSLGIHNTKYTTTLLDNTIAALSAK